ncbi:hypothetical protein B5E82_08980 [Lachnoclostridium sp. An138]|nr:hypothetical protein B5E82_08980 [Lachnoclostridium sp. An138]
MRAAAGSAEKDCRFYAGIYFNIKTRKSIALCRNTESPEALCGVRNRRKYVEKNSVSFDEIR